MEAMKNEVVLNDKKLEVRVLEGNNNNNDKNDNNNDIFIITCIIMIIMIVIIIMIIMMKTLRLTHMLKKNLRCGPGN